MTNRKLESRPWAFQRAIDGVRTLRPSKGGSKAIFLFFNEIQFQTNKVCYNVSLCKTCSGKLVVRSFPYLTVHRFWRET